MNYDKFGQAYCTEEDLCEILYKDPEVNLSNFKVTEPGKYNQSIELTYSGFPILQRYFEFADDSTVELFDSEQQQNWHMPQEYKELDIAQHILDLCNSDAELQRVGHELMLYQERNLFDLLRYLKYFVDTMRTNKVLWGLGRGSSVASYVLYLLGVHRINSMYYDLSIEEFLK
jgi:DNA polymerase III alpha subunit